MSFTIMEMKKGKIYIGTSGWKYAHWEGTFYPELLKKKDHLKYFTSIFQTVELNNSFYRQPKIHNFQSWREQVPDNFIYSVKANRYFTHLKKLKVSKEEIEIFIEAASGLKEKLGPILFQLPPRWKINIERLENFLSILPKGERYTLEFRDHTWYTPEVYALLEKYNCAFCIYELAGHQSPLWSTADFVYIRLHGPGEKYQGSYSDESLAGYYRLLHTWLEYGKDVYLYFDNDEAGYAAKNAITLQQMFDNETTDR